MNKKLLGIVSICICLWAISSFAFGASSNVIYNDSTESVLNTVIGGNRSGKNFEKSIVKTITLLTSNVVPMDAENSWDASNALDGSVMAWIKTNESDSNMIDLYIGGDGSLKAPENSKNLFALYKNLTEINGLENLNTKNVTTMKNAFAGCKSLTSLTFGSMFSSTTYLVVLDGMFDGCSNLSSLDLSGLVSGTTYSVTDMFNDCDSLTDLEFPLSSVSSLTSTDFPNCYYKVGSKWALSLEEAYELIEGDTGTIVLVGGSNKTTEIEDDSNIVIEEGKNITIDLDDNTIVKGTYGITNNGTLTIETTGTISTEDVDLIINNGTLNIGGKTNLVNTNNSKSVVVNNNITNISGGTLTGYGDQTIKQLGQLLSISDGYIENLKEDYVVEPYLPRTIFAGGEATCDEGVINITGGEIVANYVAVVVNNQVFTVNQSGDSVVRATGNENAFDSYGYYAPRAKEINIGGSATVHATNSGTGLTRGIYIGKGSLNVISGTIISTGNNEPGIDAAIFISASSVNASLGISGDGSVSQSKPDIRASHAYGVYGVEGTTLNFFDGIILGTADKSINEIITVVPETNYEVLKNTSGETEVALLSLIQTEDKVTIDLKKTTAEELENYTNSGVKVSIRSGETATEDILSTVITGKSNYQAVLTEEEENQLESGTTYYIFASKDSNHKDDLVYSGVSFVASTDATATLNYYELEIGTMYTSVTVNGTEIANKGKVVVLGGTADAQNNYAHEVATEANEGYSFEEWQTVGTVLLGSTTNATTKAKVSTAGILSSIAFPNTYTIRLNTTFVDSSDVILDSILAIYDEDVTLPLYNTLDNSSLNPINNGKSFNGWATTKNSSEAEYEDGATISNLTTENDATIDLYATWETRNYRVGSTYFDTLLEAYTAVSSGDGTITVVSSGFTDNSNVTMSSGYPVTLNMNGQTFTRTGSITNNGSLTINGSGTMNITKLISNNGTLNITGNGNIASNTGVVLNNGTLSIGGTVTISSTHDYNKTITNYGNATISGGTITGAGSSVIMQFGPTMTISGGHIEGTRETYINENNDLPCAILVSGDAATTLNITGGEIVGKYLAVSVGSTEAIINQSGNSIVRSTGNNNAYSVFGYYIKNVKELNISENAIVRGNNNGTGYTRGIHIQTDATGILNIAGGTVETNATSANIGETNAAIYIGNANVSVNVGTSGDGVTDASPVIMAEGVNGIFGVNNSKLYFYDGIIVGTEEKAIHPNITVIPEENYGVYKYATSGETEVAMLRSKCFVRFNPNAEDVSGEMVDQEYLLGVEANLNENTFVKDGFAFIGWATSAESSTVAYEDTASITVETMTPGEIIELYAIWTKKNFQVGSEYFETLEDAYNAVTETNNVIKVMADGFIDTSSVTNDKEFAIILNLNEHGFKCTNTIINNGEMTVTGNGVIINDLGRVITNNGTFILEESAVLVGASSSGATFANFGYTTINKGEILGNGSYTVLQYGPSMTINDGIIVNEKEDYIDNQNHIPAAFHINSEIENELNILGGHIIAKYIGLAINSAKTTINQSNESVIGTTGNGNDYAVIGYYITNINELNISGDATILVENDGTGTTAGILIPNNAGAGTVNVTGGSILTSSNSAKINSAI